MGNAHPVLSYRRDLPNGEIIQVVVWSLPESLPGSFHLFKYRLHYQDVSGATFIKCRDE